MFPPDVVARLLPEFEANFRGESREFLNELGGRVFKHFPQPVFGQDGKVKYVVGFISEVTSLQRMQEQLAAANRELETFAYTVSHDLRTPLTVIDTCAQVMRLHHGDALAADGRAALERIQSATLRMAQPIDDLLRLSRATRGEVKREPVDLTAMVLAIASDLKQRNAARQVEFQAQPSMVAMADARLLRVVMENLLSNAWKYTSHHPHAKIEVGLREVHGRPAFFVRDDGAGFDMKDADRLFRPFTRLHPTAQFEGTGIGLATVQRIVERHGGEIRGEGAPEKGATFTFTL
jgi:signal transduction histidine kinase